MAMQHTCLRLLFRTLGPAVGFCAFLIGIVLTGVTLAQSPPQAGARLTEFQRPISIPFPADNPYTVEKARLGRLLFFDPVLSASGTISCASCHNPGLSWGDGLPRAIGEARQPLPWRSPTVLAMAWAEVFGWDGKFPSLESVAFTPITGVSNMNRKEADLIRDIAAVPAYRIAFEEAAPGQGITRATMEQALGTYQRTLVPGDSAFDRWVAGSPDAVSDAAKRGFDLFTGRANCAQCHSGWRLTDDSFHDIGTASGANVGRGRMFPNSPTLRYAFKTPTLRDVAHRAPYMHDGSIKTLADVIALYDRGGIDRPGRDPLIRPLGLSEGERKDLLAFLQTLSGDPVEVPVPVLPR